MNLSTEANARVIKLKKKELITVKKSNLSRILKENKKSSVTLFSLIIYYSINYLINYLQYWEILSPSVKKNK